MRKFLVVLLLLSLMSCRNERDKSSYKTSYTVCDSLTIEVYTVFGGGALGGDLMSHYLTDSVSFRKFVGVYDNNETSFIYRWKAKQVVLVNEFLVHDTSKLVSEQILDLARIRRMKVFE